MDKYEVCCFIAVIIGIDSINLFSYKNCKHNN